MGDHQRILAVDCFWFFLEFLLFLGSGSKLGEGKSEGWRCGVIQTTVIGEINLSMSFEETVVDRRNSMG